IDVTVPVALYNQEVTKRLQRLAHTVKLHGFRPGKVPFKVVAQQFGPQVRQEVLESELEARFGNAVREQSLKVAGFPKFEPKSEGEENLVFGATFEIYPEVAIGDISSANIVRPIYEVDASDIDRTIETLRKQRGIFEPADRAAQAGDKVDIDFIGRMDDEAFEGGTAKGVEVILGQGNMISGFEDAILGMKAGETKSAEVTFPDDYHGKDVAGKKAVFDITLNRVEGLKLPEIDEDFAKSLGIENGDMEAVRAEIEANLKREVKRRIQSRMKDQVMQVLLDSTKIELPRSLVEMEKHRLAEQARQDLEARGMKTKDMPIPREMFEEQANRRVGLGLILSELVKRHELHAKPDQIRAAIEEFAQNYEHPDDVVRWHYADASRLNDAESLVLEDNVVEWALSSAKVEDKPVTFEELMGI
ncbi:MAG TPA: trigger factor, partial [Burkholderiales bacterium]|nr:trigger factor [Burkholderiales bacterium]